MFLALDSDEQEIANAASDFLQNEFPLERLHEAPEDPRQLAAFSELGWFGLSAPEAIGGVGLSLVEEMLFFQEHGRVAGPMEVLAQVLAVAICHEDEALAAPLLSGEKSVAILVDFQQSGPVRLVGQIDADYAIWVGPQGASLYQLSVSEYKTPLCLDRSVAMHIFDTSALTLVKERQGAEVWQQAQIDVSAMMIGLAERAMDMIVAYAKERQTFGRYIGAYQAVRHPCADMAVRVEGARSQLFYAATALKEAHSDAVMQIDAAKLLAERAATLNTDGNIQLHGGIGVTDELSAHLLMKRANLLSRLFGGSKQLRASLLDLSDEDVVIDKEVRG